MLLQAQPRRRGRDMRGAGIFGGDSQADPGRRAYPVDLGQPPLLPGFEQAERLPSCRRQRGGPGSWGGGVSPRAARRGPRRPAGARRWRAGGSAPGWGGGAGARDGAGTAAPTLEPVAERERHGERRAPAGSGLRGRGEVRRAGTGAGSEVRRRVAAGRRGGGMARAAGHTPPALLSPPPRPGPSRPPPRRRHQSAYYAGRRARRPPLCWRARKMHRPGPPRAPSPLRAAMSPERKRGRSQDALGILGDQLGSRWLRARAPAPAAVTLRWPRARGAGRRQAGLPSLHF